VRDKLFGFVNMEYLYQDHAVPIAVRHFSSIGTGTAPTGGSAPAFVHDFRLTSKGDWVPDEKDHVFIRYAFERSLDVDNGFLTRPAGSAANRQQSLNRYNSVLINWSRNLSSRQVNTLIYQKNYFLNYIPAFSPNNALTNPAGLAAGNEIRFPSLQDGANYRIPQRTRLARDQLRDTLYWSLGKHSLSFGGEYQYYGSDILFDLYGSGSVFMTEDFPTQNLRFGTSCLVNPCDDTDIPIGFALRSAAPVRPPTGPFVHNNYLGLFVQDDWRFKPGLTLNLGLRWDGDLDSLGATDGDKPCPSLTALDPANPNCEFIRNILGPYNSSARYKNFGPRIGFAWDPFRRGKSVVRGGYGIYYDRVILEPAELEEVLNGRVLPLEGHLGSNCSNVGGDCSKPGAKYDAGSPTLANPFSGTLIPIGTGVNVIDPKAATPYVQQFTLGGQHQFGNDYILSVDGLLNRGNRQLVPRLLRTLPPGVTTPYINCPNGRDPCTIIDPTSGKTAVAGCSPPTGTPPDPTCQQITEFQSAARTWYDAMLVSFQKRPGSGPWHPGYNVSYTLSKTFDEQPDDQVSPSGANTEDSSILDMHINNIRIDKGYSVTDERHRFVFYGNMEIPWKVNISPIWTWSSSVPMDSVVSALSGRLPNIPRNALGRQIPDGTALNAAITAYNALPLCLLTGNVAGPLPCQPSTQDPVTKLPVSITGPLPLVNPKLKFGDSFNSIDMRLTRAFHFTERHTLQFIAEGFNVLNITNIRGTTNRNYSGRNNTIDSPTFNHALDTAGKFFGSGGPRAFQFALRYSF
jgi:hypothetical protein